MLRRLPRPFVVSVTVAAIALTACGGSDGDDTAADSPAEPGTEAADEPAEESAEPEAEPADEPADAEPEPAPSGDGLTDGDVGTGVVRIDGVESTGFVGDCDISRGFGGEDVGDLGVEGIEVIVAVDNVAAGDPDTMDDDLNFIMTGAERFRVRTTNSGVITSITEIGPRTTAGSSDYVVVRFAGTLEEGGEVEADIVCRLQNQF